MKREKGKERKKVPELHNQPKSNRFPQEQPSPYQEGFHSPQL